MFKNKTAAELSPLISVHSVGSKRQKMRLGTPTDAAGIQIGATPFVY